MRNYLQPNSPRIQFLASLNDQQQQQSSYFSNSHVQTNSFNDQSDFIPFLSERDQMGKLHLQIITPTHSQKHIVKSSPPSEFGQHWNIRTRDSTKHKLKERKIKQRQFLSPEIGEYETEQISEYLKFRKQPRIIISTKEFNPEVHKKFTLLKKIEIQKIKEETRKQESEEAQTKRQSLSKIKFKSHQNLEQQIERELKLPAIQRQGSYIKSFLNSRKQQLQLSVDPTYVGFPKEFEQMIIQSKKRFKEIRNKIRSWGNDDPQDRVDELKLLAQQIVSSRLEQ